VPAGKKRPATYCQLPADNTFATAKCSQLLNSNRSYLFSKNALLLCGVALLLLPALLTNLGMLAFFDDEGIRALVALEMKLSGNHITPTLFGEYYYNKPPLYNWILLAFFEITGRFDEFTARSATVFFLLAYAGTVYFFSVPDSAKTANSKFQIPNSKSLLTALALITCGRILFWDSMLALIDICFSWVMYLLFMLIYREGERDRYGRMFVFAYGLSAIGFMLKGLPAVVFLGIALLTYLFWQKKGRQLFTWAHVAGIGIFTLIVGGYYVMYAQTNGLEEVLRTLFSESAKRTFVKHGFGQTALHLFTFPFEMWYHFLPWTLLAVYFLRKNAWALIGRNKFITWNLLVFFTTVIPYWSSVEVYPRYLLMHVPLVFSAFFYLHFQNREEDSKMGRAVETGFFVLCLLTTAASLLPHFWEAVQHVPHLHLKAASLTVALAGLSWLYWRWQAQRMLVFVLVLLVVRMGFNWFQTPNRLQLDCATGARTTAIEAAKLTEGQPLYILEYSLGLQPITAFYFTRETGQILRPRHENFDTSAFYIINPDAYPKSGYREIARFGIRWECGELVLGKINENLIRSIENRKKKKAKGKQ
jgi:4-amino-4-deoxy-L-arabinose transferase-like glycosyltransferase